jgi:hypothetical protein
MAHVILYMRIRATVIDVRYGSITKNTAGKIHAHNEKKTDKGLRI